MLSLKGKSSQKTDIGADREQRPILIYPTLIFFRCNSIHPSYIRTPMIAGVTHEEGGGALSMIPLAQLAACSEVSNLAIFLASDELSFIIGAENVVDGGMTAA